MSKINETTKFPTVMYLKYFEGLRVQTIKKNQSNKSLTSKLVLEHALW